jgi:hypothetical protein
VVWELLLGQLHDGSPGCLDGVLVAIAGLVLVVRSAEPHKHVLGVVCRGADFGLTQQRHEPGIGEPGESCGQLRGGHLRPQRLSLRRAPRVHTQRAVGQKLRHAVTVAAGFGRAGCFARRQKEPLEGVLGGACRDRRRSSRDRRGNRPNARGDRRLGRRWRALARRSGTGIGARTGEQQRGEQRQREQEGTSHEAESIVPMTALFKLFERDRKH